MKKVHKCLAVALVFLLLSGCSANTNPYEIVHEDGNYYLVISNNESEDLANEASGQIMGSVIYFASMDEMVSDINTGNFTKDEMEMISSFETDDAGRIIICDLSKLYVPILPDSVTVKKIKWTGTSYTYYLRCGDGEQFHSMKIYNSVESYNHDVDYYSNFADQTSLEVKSVSTEPSRNATVCTFTDRMGTDCQGVYYTITEGNKTLYIWEAYPLEETSEYPYIIRIFGSNNGICFEFFLSPMHERPSVEWLSQFGIREYVETSTS